MLAGCAWVRLNRAYVSNSPASVLTEGAVNVIDLDVRDMTCGACVTRIKTALLPIDGVHDVEVDLHAGRVRVTSSAWVAPSHLIAALASRRYESLVVTDFSPELSQVRSPAQK